MEHLSVFSPLVLTANLLFFLGCEIVLNIECFSDLFRRLALDHVGDSFAANVKQSLDIEIVGSLVLDRNQRTSRNRRRATHEDDFKKHLLIDLHKFLIPLIDICGLLPGVAFVIVGGYRVVLVMFAPI